jgi:hypothetical protein
MSCGIQPQRVSRGNRMLSPPQSRHGSQNRSAHTTGQQGVKRKSSALYGSQNHRSGDTTMNFNDVFNKHHRDSLPRLDLILDEDPFAAEVSNATRGFMSVRKL